MVFTDRTSPSKFSTRSAIKAFAVAAARSWLTSVAITAIGTMMATSSKDFLMFISFMVVFNVKKSPFFPYKTRQKEDFIPLQFIC
jgi:hypothetical protein